MNRIVVVLLLAILFVGMGWTDDRPVPKSALSLQGGGSLVAPAGVELEFLAGQVGLSLETRLLVWKLGGQWSGILEPGINLRFYFGGFDRSLFFFAGVGFLSFWTLSPFSMDQGILKPRSGFGYNWLLGTEDGWRLGLEIGVATLQEFIEGDLYDIMFPVVPHAMLLFGRIF